MSSDAPSQLNEVELLRAQLRVSEAARRAAEYRAAEAETRAEQERIAHVAKVEQLKIAREAINENRYLIEKLEKRIQLYS